MARRRSADRDDEDASPSSHQWWSSETGYDAQGKLWAWVTRLRAQWTVDGISDLIHEAIYADEPIAQGGTFDGQRWAGGSGGASSPLNVIMSLVDTATARLTKVRSMPCISANNAPYSKKRFARGVSRVLRHKMGGEDVEEIAPLLIRDFCIRGTSVSKVERDGGDTATRRVPIYEIVWDHREAQFHFPRTIAHVRPESREVMCARYPDFAEQIDKVALFTRMDAWMQFIYQGPQLADLIEVAEAWHLPTKPGADDGQHIVAIRGTVVLREPWNVPRYPLQFAHWTPPIRGIRGKGLVAEHQAAQEWINGILQDARNGIREGSQLKVFVPRNANVNKVHLKARAPVAIEVDGPPGQVQYVAPDPVSKQAWGIAFQMMEQMYALSGISQWAAQSKSPVGTNASGKALDTMNDNQSDRFAHVETNWQQSRVAIGRAHVDMAKHMWLEANGKTKRVFDEQPEPIAKKDLASWIADNDWSAVDLDGGDYNLTIEPINFITGTRGGKLEEIAEAGKAGLIPDPSMTAALMEEPDIARMNRPILGPLHRIERCLEGLADPKVSYMDIAPDEYMNLALAELMAKGELEEIMSDDEPDEAICQRFRNFLSDIKDKKAKANASPSLAGAQDSSTVAQANAQTLQAGMGGPPPGAGMSPMNGAAPGGAPPMPPQGQVMQ